MINSQNNHRTILDKNGIDLTQLKLGKNKSQNTKTPLSESLHSLNTNLEIGMVCASVVRLQLHILYKGILDESIDEDYFFCKRNHCEKFIRLGSYVAAFSTPMREKLENFYNTQRNKTFLDNIKKTLFDYSNIRYNLANRLLHNKDDYDLEYLLTYPLSHIDTRLTAYQLLNSIKLIEEKE